MKDSLFSFPKWDSDLLVYINSKSYTWLDPVMVLFSHYWSWIAVLSMICLFMLYKYGKHGRFAVLFMGGSVLVALVLNNILKIIIQRPRPCVSLVGNINILEDCGDAFSFFSAHSSSSFCLATFSFLYLRNRYYGIVIYIWAFVVAYSRMYVGKHYPLDVIFGILFGIIMGIAGYLLFTRYENSRLNASKKY